MATAALQVISLQVKTELTVKSEQRFTVGALTGRLWPITTHKVALSHQSEQRSDLLFQSSLWSKVSVWYAEDASLTVIAGDNYCVWAGRRWERPAGTELTHSLSDRLADKESGHSSSKLSSGYFPFISSRRMRRKDRCCFGTPLSRSSACIISCTLSVWFPACLTCSGRSYQLQCLLPKSQAVFEEVEDKGSRQPFCFLSVIYFHKQISLKHIVTSAEQLRQLCLCDWFTFEPS